MMGFGNAANDLTFPDLLAAYADGELDAAGRARVDAWLADHPDARATLQSQIQLSRRNRKLWKVSAPLAPSEGSWARVFGRVQDVLDAPVRPAVAPPRRRFRRLAAALATAAAVAVAVYVLAPGRTHRSVATTDSTVAVEPLALAIGTDVDILSIDDRDATALVVGQVPLSGTVVLAAVGDVELKGIQKAEDGMMPRVQMTDAGNAPMIVAPLAGR